MQTINVRVVPNTKRNEIKQEGGRYKVYLTAPAIEGKANKLLVEFLAGNFAVKKSRVKIIRGEKARDKVVQIG